MTKGQKIGLTDQLLRDICVGDEVTDANGVHYTIDRFGRAKPTSGGNEIPVRSLKGCEITKAYVPSMGATIPAPRVPAAKAEAPAEERATTCYIVDTADEDAVLAAIDKFVKDAGDQRLVDELRERGWNVACTKMVEKVVFEEVSL